MSNGKHDFLVGLRSLLRYHESIGISGYPRNEHVRSFLRATPELGGRSGIEPPKSASVVPAPLRQGRAAAAKSPVNMAAIATEVATCQACDLHQQRLYPVAGRGSDKVRLMIVGDWLSADEEGNLPPGHLFGVEQDLMLSRMLLAINLSASEVFVTNVIKCAVPAGCQPQAAHAQCCASFLRRQIAALLPEVICTMGTVAARAVLEKSQPLSRLRGHFHGYEVDKTRTIPVIATYHPTYLLQNPEMKQATWADLQLLAKKMGLK